MRVLNFFIALLMKCVLATAANAANVSTEDLGDGLSLIVVTGEITSGDSEIFRREAAKASRAIVALESPGGATLEAIEIGEIIRIRGFSTLVLNDSQCVSACALIWLAGTPRTLARSGSVGFHATYTDQNGQRLESGVGNALVGRYFAILNLPQRAIVFATSANPTEMNWLNASNTSDIGIDVSLIDDFVDREEVEDTNISLPAPTQSFDADQTDTTLWSQAGDWRIITDHSLGDSCFALRVFDDTYFRLGLDLRFSGTSYVILSNREWISLEVGREYPLSLQFDELDPWDAPMKASSLNGLVVLYVTVEDTSFWTEFSSSSHFSLSRDGRTFAKMPLDRSSDAMDAVIECQVASNQIRAQRDPFSN